MRMCWKRTNRFLAIVAVLGLWGACTLGEAQTISNPSFEANSFTNYPGYISSNAPIIGWTSGDTNHTGLNPYAGTNNPFADNGAVPDGTNVAFIQSLGGNSSLSTVISDLVVGETYKVNFRVNARTGVGGTPNLNVWIDASNIVNSTVTPVAPAGVTNIPYKFFAFDFTAAATNHTMTLSNDASSDQTVLLDNFSIALRNSGWSYAAWSNDASSGVSSNRNYTHAFAFGTSASPIIINGVTFTGTGASVANPSSNGVFSTAGLPNVFTNDANNLTSGGGGSGMLASNFLWGGANESITIRGLTIGKAYVATIYSVGFHSPDSARAATFTAGNDRLTVNQDQFGYYNGIRVSRHFTANATASRLTYVPLNTNNTFHTYGFSVYQVPELVVTNAADSGPGSLRQLVSQADVFSLITFTNTLSGQTIVLTGGQITTSNNITIDGSSLPAGISLSGNNSNRIFEVSSGATLSLNALTLTNGYAGSGGSGGAILVDLGGTLMVNNSTLSGNSASGAGGGIDNAGLAIITNSTFSGNTAAGAGAIENDNSTLIINGSTLSGNISTGNGGAIDNDAGALLQLDNSTLAGNSAVGGGGGIENYQATAILNNSTISTNSAGGAGGINNFGALVLTNTIVAGNAAPFLPDLNLDPSGTFAGANNLTNGNPLLAPLGNYGGPTQTMPPLTGSPVLDAGTDSVTNFLATDQRGFPRRAGAHVDIGAVEYFVSPLVTTTADAGGGSLRNAATYATNGTTITFTNTLSGQTIVLTNGQITLYDNVTIDASSLPAGITLSGNHASRIFQVSAGTIVTLDSLTLTNGYAAGDSGGAIIVGCPGGTLTLNNSTLSGNSADIDGGGIYGACRSAVTLNNSTLSGNTAGDGGGIYEATSTEVVGGGTLIVNNSTLSGNSAANDGGGIYGGGISAEKGIILPALFFTNTIVAGNFAPTNTDISGKFTAANNLVGVNPHLAPLGNYGGPTQTMPPLPDSPALDAGTDSVTNFLATDQRGLPRKIGPHVDIGAAEYVSVSTMVTNIADSGAGTLRDAATDRTNSVTITFAPALSGRTNILTNGQVTISVPLTIDASALSGGFTISGNNNSRVFELAGGAAVTLNSLTIQDGNINGNGGGICTDIGANLTLTNCTLSGNSGNPGGGLFFSSGALAIYNSTFSSNSAGSNSLGGGGIFLNGGTATISGSTFSSNSALGRGANGGGGIFVNPGSGANLALANCTLSGNSTVSSGGGIYFGGTTLTVNGSTFYGNSADGGGGIYNDVGSTLTLNNSTLSGNSAGIGGGGGIFCGGTTLIVNNSTLSGNSAEGGGGIGNFNGAVFLTNTIVAGNFAEESPTNIFSYSGSFTGANNLTNGNPLLAPLGNYGGPTQTMAPVSGSPAIDAGTDAVTNFLATDQRGYPRLSGAHVDIGAVELQFVAVPAPVLKNMLWTNAGGSNTFQFSFTNVSGADFTALASTNVSLPLSNWTVLGNAQEISAGQYQFIDSGTNNYPKRFYVVVSP